MPRTFVLVREISTVSSASLVACALSSLLLELGREFGRQRAHRVPFPASGNDYLNGNLLATDLGQIQIQDLRTAGLETPSSLAIRATLPPSTQRRLIDGMVDMLIISFPAPSGRLPWQRPGWAEIRGWSASLLNRRSRRRETQIFLLAFSKKAKPKNTIQKPEQEDGRRAYVQQVGELG